MAEHMGVVRSTYVRNEGARTYPGTPAYHKLCNKLGISLDWLIGGKGEMFSGKPEGELAAEFASLAADAEKVPLLRYDLLSFYHRFKLDNPGLFEEKEGD